MRLTTLSFVLIAALVSPVTRAYSLYPAIDGGLLAQVLSISIGCLDALNATVDCDDDLFPWTVETDNYFWSTENVTDLCTSACLQSASTWSSTVSTQCINDTIPLYGSLVPADSVSGRYIDGLNLTCLQPQSTANRWCMIESLEWVGSDYITPDCQTDPTDPYCTNGTFSDDNTRLANLYNNTLLCDDCFLSMLWQRLSSPYLADADFSDYLLGEFYDAQAVCTKTLADLYTRTLPVYTPLPTPTTNYSSPLPPVNGTVTCPGGQVVTGPTSTSTATATSTTTAATTTTGPGCNALSQQYNITTGDLQFGTGSDNCDLPSFAICLPGPCNLALVPSNATCDSLAAEFIPASSNLTTTQFLYWNPNILGLCDNVTEGQYICANAPGGTYSLPPVPTGSNGDGASSLRGGPGPTVPPDGTTTSSTPVISGTPIPSPTQSGIVSNCNKFAVANSDDYCYTFAPSHGITPTDLYTWNTQLGPNGDNCTTSFWVGYYYCIGIPGATITTTTTSSTPAAPGPTQSGIVSSCSQYASPSSGSSCTAFIQTYSLNANSFYTWNPVLGINGANCATKFQVGEYYCIAVYPTQSGVASNCNKYAEAKSGDTCTAFANTNGITTTQLYTWNGVLGKNGEDCANDLWAGEYYCVGVGS